MQTAPAESTCSQTGILTCGARALTTATTSGARRTARAHRPACRRRPSGFGRGKLRRHLASLSRASPSIRRSARARACRGRARGRRWRVGRRIRLGCGAGAGHRLRRDGAAGPSRVSVSVMVLRVQGRRSGQNVELKRKRLFMQARSRRTPKVDWGNCPGRVAPASGPFAAKRTIEEFLPRVQ